MAKKSRRARHRSANVAQPVRLSQPARSLSSQAAVKKEVDFSEEYGYVVQDLRRIAITAAALLVLLIALALIIS
jgi:hypothetical protein